MSILLWIVGSVLAAYVVYNLMGVAIYFALFGGLYSAMGSIKKEKGEE